MGCGLCSSVPIANDQRQCTTLRSELALAHSQVADLQSQRDNFRNDLMAAETRLDRLQSRTVQSMQSHSVPPKETVDDEGEGSKLSGGPSDGALKSSPPMVRRLHDGGLQYYTHWQCSHHIPMVRPQLIRRSGRSWPKLVRRR